MEEWVQVRCEEMRKRISLPARSAHIVVRNGARVEMKYPRPLGGAHQKRTRQHVVASYGNHSGWSVHVQEGALVFLHGENHPLFSFPPCCVQTPRICWRCRTLINKMEHIQSLIRHVKMLTHPQNKTKIWAQNSCLVGDKCHSATRDSSFTSCWGGGNIQQIHLSSSVFVLKWVWKESFELVCFYLHNHTTEREEIWKILQYWLRSRTNELQGDEHIHHLFLVLKWY